MLPTCNTLQQTILIASMIQWFIPFWKSLGKKVWDAQQQLKISNFSLFSIADQYAGFETYPMTLCGHIW